MRRFKLSLTQYLLETIIIYSWPSVVTWKEVDYSSGDMQFQA